MLPISVWNALNDRLKFHCNRITKYISKLDLENELLTFLCCGIFLKTVIDFVVFPANHTTRVATAAKSRLLLFPTDIRVLITDVFRGNVFYLLIAFFLLGVAAHQRTI